MRKGRRQCQIVVGRLRFYVPFSTVGTLGLRIISTRPIAAFGMSKYVNNLSTIDMVINRQRQ